MTAHDFFLPYYEPLSTFVTYFLIGLLIGAMVAYIGNDE